MPDEAAERGRWPTSLAEYVGLEHVSGEGETVTARMEVRPEHIAPNGYLQASVAIALADMTCARGTLDTLPEGARGFTTVELKTNLLGTALEGGVRCVATRQHGGRTTQVWDAVITSEKKGRKMALFRCTQLLLYPREPEAARRSEG